MPEIKWKDKHCEIKAPKKPKKLTGTRFATVLGLNPWATPFEIWCAVTRMYEKPFEDTIYTVAGKTIEPKQAQYMKDSYLMDNLRTPTDIYGADYFQKTYGDFFPKEPVLGGMWDYLLMDDKGKISKVLEMKTTKRSEDWAEDVPEYYALQASLYAYLLGVDDVIMVCSFLEPSDYEHPENFQPSVQNTIIRPFKVSERYPHFQLYVDQVLNWWEKYVSSGISPDFDEKKDAEILKALRTTTVDAGADLKELITEAEGLKAELDENAKAMKAKEDRLKKITDKLKEVAKGQFKDGDTEVTIPGSRYCWKMTRSNTMKVDEAALKKDGLYDKYAKATASYRMTCNEIKEEKN